MECEIVKFDNLGRGISYINGKIVFVPKALPGDICKIDIVLEKKGYIEGKLINIIKPSKDRIKSMCPFFNECGGCDFLNTKISNSLEYKLNNINELLNKSNINYEVINITKSDKEFNYRNKVTLKIENKKIGYYENNTHNIVSIDKCLLCNNKINEVIQDLELLDINNGEVIIRCNYKNEILLIINSKDDIKINDSFIDDHLIVGIIHNNKVIYGDDYFIDKIDNYLFKVSYDSFFQVNPYITSKIFKKVIEYTNNSTNILDFYSGVGTLGIVSSKNKNVLGVEIVKNAVKDAILNKSLNNVKNIEFICDDTNNIIDMITKDFDTIIVDPPRSGVSTKVIERIINEKIKKIIYISCNPITLIRDLSILTNYYKISNLELFDMFPNTEHVESFCVLERK